MQLNRIIIVVIIFLSSGAFSNCQCQDIVGKWKMVSSTKYFTAEGKSRMGEASHTYPVLPTTGSVITDFKSDHTYTTTNISATNPTPSVLKGTWNLIGDQLTVTSESTDKTKKEPVLSTMTISIKGNTMTIINPSIFNNNLVSKTTTESVRI